MDDKKVNIAGLDKAAVLAALYNAKEPMGLGWLQARDGDMTKEQAQELITPDGGVDDRTRHFGRLPQNDGRLYFDYVFGRPLKIDISGDEFDPGGYDRDARPGAAEEAIAALREKVQG